MKECFKCHRTLPVEEFYKHPQMGDGHLNKCKDCARKDVKENRSAKREQYSEYERNRYKEPDRHAYMVEKARQHKQLNPQKAHARRAVNNRKRYGQIVEQPCAFYGNPKVQAHHDDYSKPLDVVWVCFKCHREKYHNQVVVSDYGQA